MHLAIRRTEILSVITKLKKNNNVKKTSIISQENGAINLLNIKSSKIHNTIFICNRKSATLHKGINIYKNTTITMKE